LRLSGGEVLTPNGFINLVTMDRNVARRLNADLHISGTNVEYRNFDVISNDKAFIFLSRKN
jgi:hypothetical protein